MDGQMLKEDINSLNYIKYQDEVYKLKMQLEYVRNQRKNKERNELYQNFLDLKKDYCILLTALSELNSIKCADCLENLPETSIDVGDLKTAKKLKIIIEKIDSMLGRDLNSTELPMSEKNELLQYVQEKMYAAKTCQQLFMQSSHLFTNVKALSTMFNHNNKQISLNETPITEELCSKTKIIPEIVIGSRENKMLRKANNPESCEEIKSQDESVFDCSIQTITASRVFTSSPMS